MTRVGSQRHSTKKSSYPVPVESSVLPHTPLIFLLVQVLVIYPRPYLSRLLQLLMNYNYYYYSYNYLRQQAMYIRHSAR